MYVVPDTHLEFFQNLNIDSDYENTIYFPTTQAKDAYFAQLPSIKTPNCTYQREKRGYCRVEIPIGQLYGRCYMRFRNNQFENKWFYAFVDNVEYINNITTEVKYTIDVMMTWMGGSYTLDECFIERQHSETDNIGDNLVPEPVDIDVKVHKSVSTSGTFTNWGYIVAMKPTAVLVPSAGDMGYFSGLHYNMWTSDSDLELFINNLSGEEQESIVGIFKIPLNFYPNIHQGAIDTGNPPISYTRNIPKPVAGVTTLSGGITPTNNKLYTYPYYNLLVASTEGDRVEYPYELFASPEGTNNAVFEIRGLVGEQTQISLIPKGFKVPSSSYPCYTEAITMNDFSMVSWWTDTFKAFLAQQKIALPSMAVDVAGGLASLVATGNPAPLTGAVIPIVENVSKNLIKSKLKPLEAHGKDNTNLSMVTGAYFKDFYFFEESIRPDVARRIDNFFTMFGYAQNIVAKPNINARPYYTYVKTLGCHINGSFPEEDKRQIESIFNRGVRFWKEDHRYIGKYSEIDNSPTGA